LQRLCVNAFKARQRSIDAVFRHKYLKILMDIALAQCWKLNAKMPSTQRKRYAQSRLFFALLSILGGLAL
jgi:hypothetical protein